MSKSQWESKRSKSKVVPRETSRPFYTSNFVYEEREVFLFPIVLYINIEKGVSDEIFYR